MSRDKKEKEPIAWQHRSFPCSTTAPERTINKAMIRYFGLMCKVILERYSEDEMLDKAIAEYQHYGERCPSCRAIGMLKKHSSYTRNLVSINNGKVTSNRAVITRFICSSCGRTHALLPDIIIPYNQFSLRFILSLLVAYFEREESVAAICEGYGISESTLYRWKRVLSSHADLLFGFLEATTQSTLTIIRRIVDTPELSLLLKNFYQRFSFSFLQTRHSSATQSRPP